jgi:hypothetical protein
LPAFAVPALARLRIEPRQRPVAAHQLPDLTADELLPRITLCTNPRPGAPRGTQRQNRQQSPHACFAMTTVSRFKGAASRSARHARAIMRGIAAGAAPGRGASGDKPDRDGTAAVPENRVGAGLSPAPPTHPACGSAPGGSRCVPEAAVRIGESLEALVVPVAVGQGAL